MKIKKKWNLKKWKFETKTKNKKICKRKITENLKQKQKIRKYAKEK